VFIAASLLASFSVVPPITLAMVERPAADLAPGIGDAYCAAKAALRSYTRTWTREFNDRGIRFNTLSPGPIDTPILDGQAGSVEAANEIKAQLVAEVPLNRLGRPDEIAAAALFLASDDSSFVAGAELSVDGGQAQV
jgi:NAD(P)-dependent dehydrogenase (short-subunit alcohol dehydrogenase family)